MNNVFSKMEIDIMVGERRYWHKRWEQIHRYLSVHEAKNKAVASRRKNSQRYGPSLSLKSSLTAVSARMFSKFLILVIVVTSLMLVSFGFNVDLFCFPDEPSYFSLIIYSQIQKGSGDH